MNLKEVRNPRSKMQDLLRATSRPHVVLQLAFPDGIQKREEADKVRLPGAIRADDHVDGAQSQRINRCEALEAFNSDVIEFRRRHADFALRLSSDGFNLFRAVKRAWAF